MQPSHMVVLLLPHLSPHMTHTTGLQIGGGPRTVKHSIHRSTARRLVGASHRKQVTCMVVI